MARNKSPRLFLSGKTSIQFIQFSQSKLYRRSLIHAIFFFITPWVISALRGAAERNKLSGGFFRCELKSTEVIWDARRYLDYNSITCSLGGETSQCIKLKPGIPPPRRPHRVHVSSLHINPRNHLNSCWICLIIKLPEHVPRSIRTIDLVFSALTRTNIANGMNSLGSLGVKDSFGTKLHCFRLKSKVGLFCFEEEGGWYQVFRLREHEFADWNTFIWKAV